MDGVRAQRSSIWYHFIRKDQLGKCYYCQKGIVISRGATSNLLRHLRLKHPTVLVDQHRYREVLPSSHPPASEEPSCSRDPAVHVDVSAPALVSPGPSGSISCSQSTSTATSDPSRLLDTVSPRLAQDSIQRYVEARRPMSIKKKREIDTYLLEVICNEYQPFSIVENKKFRKFTRALNPTYELPSRKTLSDSLLPAMYNEMLEKIKTMLDKAPAVCLTCDGWTNLNSVGFYAITAHFCGSDFQLKSALLECSEFTERHTSNNISEWISTILQKFHIRYKISAIVTDNAPNMKKAAEILNIRHLPCFAHSLNLAVQTAIANTIKTTVDKVKSTVQFFKQSSTASSKLSDMQKTMGAKVLKLKQDVPTRWNSTFTMLDRFLETKEPLITALALSSSSILFTENEWIVIEQSIDMLRVFFEVTEDASASKTTSLSKTGILIRGMLTTVKSQLENKELSEDVRALGKALVEELSQRFGGREAHELVSQSIFLDPRFKKKGFGDDIRFQETLRIVTDKITVAISTRQEVVHRHNPVKDLEQGVTSNCRIWDLYDANESTIQSTSNPRASAIVEVDKYVAEPGIHRSMDPLKWWEKEKDNYPNLFQLSQRRLCIPATSVPCERIFSKAGQIYTEKRSRLTTSKVSKMLFINNNSDLFEED